MITPPPKTDTLQAAQISAAIHQGLTVKTRDGRPARLAIIDEDGNALDAGKAVERDVRGWIPVDERLPEKAKVAFNCGFSSRVLFYSDECGIFVSTATYPDNGCDPHVPNRATHWMPLPEAPNAGTQPTARGE